MKLVRTQVYQNRPASGAVALNANPFPPAPLGDLGFYVIELCKRLVFYSSDGGKSTLSDRALCQEVTNRLELMMWQIDDTHHPLVERRISSRPAVARAGPSSPNREPYDTLGVSGPATEILRVQRSQLNNALPKRDPALKSLI
jgi:hypothetical protein